MNHVLYTLGWGDHEWYSEYASPDHQGGTDHLFLWEAEQGSNPAAWHGLSQGNQGSQFNTLMYFLSFLFGLKYSLTHPFSLDLFV